MQIWQDPQSAALTHDMLWFSSSLCNATSGVFFWVGDEYEVVAPEPHRLPHGLLNHYEEFVGPHDRMNMRELERMGDRVSMLRQDWERLPMPPTSQYLSYLYRFDILDEIDLVFHMADRPMACLTLFRNSHCAPFSNQTLDWEQLRRHFETMLQSHWRARSLKLQHALTRRFDLKAREIEVVEMLTVGASNLDISEALGIGVPTVKTHVFNILNKLGLDNRSSVVALVNQLQYAAMPNA